MSLTALLVFGILALDFVIYYCFLHIFGDRRAALAREIASLRAQLPDLHAIPSHQNAPDYSARHLHRATISTLECL